MLRLSGSLNNQPVLSLRTGTQVALAQAPIINPHSLKIIGWWCKVLGTSQQVALLADNIREINANGIAINDEDDLSPPEDLVRHQEVLNIRFQLIEKLVRTKRSKLGKVSDFSYNDGLMVQKLYVSRPLVKLFSSDDTLIIDRSQILEVTDQHILVRDTEVKATEDELAGAAAPA